MVDRKHRRQQNKVAARKSKTWMSCEKWEHSAQRVIRRHSLTVVSMSSLLTYDTIRYDRRD